MPEPADPERYCFERGVTKTGSARVERPRTDGFADVWLRALWQDPERFKPRRTNREITEEAARTFAGTAERVRAAAGAPSLTAGQRSNSMPSFLAALASKVTTLALRPSASATIRQSCRSTPPRA